MEYITKGITAGVVLSFMVGPILIAIVEQSIKNGRRAGLSLASGIWLSDLIFILICFYSLDWITQWSTNERAMLFLGLFGSLVLTGMGLYNLKYYKSDIRNPEERLKTGTKRLALVKGFTLNTFNPFTLAFWIGISVYFSQDNIGAQVDFIKMTISLLITIILFDGLKVLAAGYLRKKLSPENLAKIKYITGLAFIGFGIFIAMRVISTYGL